MDRQNSFLSLVLVRARESELLVANESLCDLGKTWGKFKIIGIGSVRFGEGNIENPL